MAAHPRKQRASRIMGLQQALGMRQQGVACRREAHRRAAARYQLHLQLVLKLLMWAVTLDCTVCRRWAAAPKLPVLLTASKMRRDLSCMLITKQDDELHFESLDMMHTRA